VGFHRLSAAVVRLLMMSTPFSVALKLQLFLETSKSELVQTQIIQVQINIVILQLHSKERNQHRMHAITFATCIFSCFMRYPVVCKLFDIYKTDVSG